MFQALTNLFNAGMLRNKKNKTPIFMEMADIQQSEPNQTLTSNLTRLKPDTETENDRNKKNPQPQLYFTVKMPRLFIVSTHEYRPGNILWPQKWGNCSREWQRRMTTEGCVAVMTVT